MQAMKQTDENKAPVNKEDLLQGMDLLSTQLKTIDQQITSKINKKVQKKVQYQRQHIMHVQNTLLSWSSPLSLE